MGEEGEGGGRGGGGFNAQSTTKVKGHIRPMRETATETLDIVLIKPQALSTGVGGVGGEGVGGRRRQRKRESKDFHCSKLLSTENILYIITYLT